MSIRLPKSGIFFYTILACSIIFFLYRHNLLGFEKHYIILLSNRPNIGIFRLLNFLLIVYLVWVAIENISIDKGIPWLQFIGRYSIQVFSFHVLLLYLLLPIWLNINKDNYLISISFELLVVASLTIPAYLAQRYKGSKK